VEVAGQVRIVSSDFERNGNRPIRSQDDIVVDVSAPFVEEFFCD
jgi:hypothetical protein